MRGTHQLNAGITEWIAFKFQFMQDESIHTDARNFLSRVDDRDSFIQLCREYFEIAIGYRRPTDEERTQAGKWLIKGTLFGEEATPERVVKIMKYPYSFNRQEHIQLIYQFEYIIFQILAEETTIVEGPYLPMFRYEILKQKSLAVESKYDTAVLRQSAFLETLFKMKMGKWKDSEGNFLNWELCVACVYRGENLITEDMKDRLRIMVPVRNRYAHDWRQYTMRKGADKTEIKEAFVCGLGVIAELFSQELSHTFSDYTSKHVSKRLPITWEDREKSEMTGSATATVGITCDSCGHEFIPREEGWKRCPNCDSPHDYLDRFSTPDN